MTFNQNPTQTKAWSQLKNKQQQSARLTLNELFKEDHNRKEKYTLSLDELSFQFANNHIDDETLQLLEDLAHEMNLKEAINSLFSGDSINTTENRAVLHVALRDFEDHNIVVNGEEVFPMVDKARQKIKQFTEQVLSGQWKGHTGKSITDVVNIGIGGSDLGPQMAVESLQFYQKNLNIHFISNVDGDSTHAILNNLNPETTLFIVVSKTFTTIETLTNAQTCRKWLLQSAPETAIKHHFAAVSTNEQAVKDFGIDTANIFPMWDWVGGRFSMWSSVGLSIALAIGYEQFEAFLKGAHSADKHFKTAGFKENIPVMMGLLSVWYVNFYKTKAQLILPYAEALNKLPAYLQQLFMESNGKSVDRQGQTVNYQTGPVIFGAAGTNAQHSFMQLIHQGTQLIPADFIGFRQSLYNDQEHHSILMANFKAQAQALREGKTAEQVHLSMKISGSAEHINQLLPYKIFEGNRVSNTLMFERLTPYNLGMLIALYEHKVFVEGVLWNINSFDQFGVELGKEMAKKLQN
ncbi:MAG: glucose-6-phosphate isomerase [Flavobacteriales bacterium]|nr:MAG: glucose-6-phosphate isomerase [Flavobacteriales bacterium]